MERFAYHAAAVGLEGRITEPFNEVLPIRASVALPPSGGFGTSRSTHIRFHDIISAEAVTSVVAGSRSDRDGTHDALSTVTIEHLDVLGMVQADRIVARMALSHPESGGPPEIIPLGSHFQNLRIAGYHVRVNLATDIFTRFDTAEKVRKAYRDDEDAFREEFNRLALVGRSSQIPQRLHSYFSWRNEQPSESIPETHGDIHCGLVRSIEGLGEEIEHRGHTIYIRGFGVIRLAEFSITDALRSLTMLQIDLGSTPQGSVSAASVGSGGTGGTGSSW